MIRRIAAAMLSLAVVGVSACGRDEPEFEPLEPGYAVGDSLVPINDEALVTEDSLPEAEPPVAVQPTPPPAAAPRPRPTPPPAPAPTPARASNVLENGTTLATTTIDSIHSRHNTAGDLVRARVAQDVTNGDGRVIIPAGALVTLQIVEIAPAANKGESATLVLSARTVAIGGIEYPLDARVTAYDSELKSRGIGTGEVAKTAGGAAAGGIIGRVIGGRTGTVIGAIGGAAAGAAIADKTVDRDIVVVAGSNATITLRGDFSRQSD